MAVTNTQALALTGAQRAQLEGWLVEFERTWGVGRLADQVRELPPGPLRFPALVELVKIDLERSWAAGARPTVESYLSAYPELGSPDTVPADLLQAEWEARQRQGEAATLDGFAARFPGRSDDLRRLLEEGAGAQTFAKLSTLRQPGAAPGPDTTRVEPDVVLRLEREGRYQVVRKLGRGGMGSVYLVRDTRLDRLIALKVPRFDGDDGPEVRERFYREARAVSALRHPNICPVYDVGEIEGVPYLTMAYIEGQPLSHRLTAGPPPSPAEAAELVRKLARALEAPHGRGIIHRDLKPANIMLGANGEPVVMDFGLARRADTGDVRLTRPGALLGTPAYMSPEQAAGDSAAVGPASDVYSLGVMLYEMVTGRLPFTGSLADVLWQIRAEEPKQPTELRPDLNPQLEGIIMRAMTKSVEKRYASVSEFAAAVDDYLRQEESRTGPVNRVAPYLARPAAAGTTVTRPPIRWLRWAVAAALLGGMALLLAEIVIHYKGKDGNDKSEVISPLPGSTVRIIDDTGKKLGSVPVPLEPSKPQEGSAPGAKNVIAPPQNRPVDWDVSPDGKTLARVYDEDVELWDTQTGKLRAKVKAASDRAGWLNFSPDSRLLAVGSYKRVTVWDIKGEGEPKELFRKNIRNRVYGLLFLADSKQLLAVAEDYVGWVWDAESGKELRSSDKMRYMVQGIWHVAPDRKRVYTPAGPESGTGTMLNTADLTTENVHLDTHNAYSVAFSSDGKRLLYSDEDVVKLYDMDRKTSQTVHNTLHTKDVYLVSLSPDGKLAASGGKDRTAVLYDLEAKKVTTYKGFDGPVGVRFSPDGKMLLAWTKNGKTVRRWDVAGGKELPSLSGHDGGIVTVFFRGEGKYLFVCEDNGKVTRYDTAGLPK